MEVAYYPGEWPEAEITATTAEFAAMAARVAELARAGAGEAIFPAIGSGLSFLALRVGSGPATVALCGDGLSVSGNTEALGLFGRNMPTKPSLPARYHVHFEHAARESFVAAESIPLIMMVGSGPDA